MTKLLTELLSCHFEMVTLEWWMFQPGGKIESKAIYHLWSTRPNKGKGKGAKNGHLTRMLGSAKLQFVIIQISMFLLFLNLILPTKFSQI